jgi:hypothetical protein
MYFIEKTRAFLDFINKNDTIAQILCLHMLSNQCWLSEQPHPQPTVEKIVAQGGWYNGELFPHVG